MKKPCIYALTDPITHGIVYIGRTLYPDARLRNHINCPNEYTNLGKWISSLNRGLPGFLTIEQFDFPLEKHALFARHTMAARERFWIEYLSTSGIHLLNMPCGVKPKKINCKINAKIFASY